MRHPFATETARAFAHRPRKGRGVRAWRCACGELVPGRLEVCDNCGGERERGLRVEWTEREALRACDAVEV
jgi:hypothetical protein